MVGLDDITDPLVDVLENIGEELKDGTLALIRGAGEAVVDGVDATYDYLREKFYVGNEKDIIAGFTVGMLTILTGVYVWNAVRNTADTL